MKYASVLLAVGCLLSAVKAQWLETATQLPDSAQPFVLCDNSTNNKVFPPQNLYHDSLAVLFMPSESTTMPIDSVWLDSLFGPSDTVDTGFQCGVAVCCSGVSVNVDGSWSFINPHGAVVYIESFSYEVVPGESVVVASTPFTIVDTGLWTIRCTIPTDSVIWRFRGRRMPGIEEGQPQASSHELPPTVLRRLPPGTVAFDAMGRRVLDPKSGVYFVRSEPSAVAVRKVILQR
ncbi:MAG: hypothetical protein NTX53_04090 [candidate division WOR-3 bacterium]|nr:hypothetical protein [candidate division WOR-3 bacterium]